jgi:hypothetical protein
MTLKETVIAFLATFAMAHSGYAADATSTPEKKTETVKTQKAKAPEPTATPGVHKIEKKPKELVGPTKDSGALDDSFKQYEAKSDKPAKPKVKRPEELKAEQEAKK